MLMRRLASPSSGLLMNRSAVSVQRALLSSNQKSLDQIFKEVTNISNFTITPQIEKEVHIYSHKKETPVSLRSLMETGKGEKLHHFDELVKTKFAQDVVHHDSAKILIQIACFLHRELPVRLAHRASQLEATPLFVKSPHLRQICNWYKTSFAQLRSLPVPNDPAKEELFHKVVASVYERHSGTLMAMAKGAHEIRSQLKHDVGEFADLGDIQKRMDDFYMSRIGIRILIGQYLALHDPSLKGNPDTIGLISVKASPYEIAKQVIEDASYICSRTHGEAPEVTIHGRTDLHFTYIPSHIYYILFELLKNSMRATVETHGVDKMPPIRIVIADGEENEDVVIKVSDEGGGIRRSNMNRVWSYLFTTAHPSVLERMLGSDSDDVKDFGVESPLAGLGYGLPIARNYARCFSGDLTLMSMEGYGTDSFIYLPRLGKTNSTV